MDKPLNYENALSELNQILDAIENQTIGIDKINEYTARASYLIDFCKNRLRNLELENDKILNLE
jgi:exodeoxyribonuclease VII small subunit